MVSLSDFMRRRNSINKKSSTSSGNAPSDSNSVSCFPFTRFSKKHRSSCSVTDETSDSTDHNHSRSEMAAWRVDKILDGPPREEDWWVNTADAKSEPPPEAAAAVTSDDSFDSSAECDHSTAKSRLSSGGETSLASSSSPHYSNSNNSTSDNSSSAASTTTTTRRFRNRGLETWVVARDAWRQPCEDVTQRHHVLPPTRSDPPSPAMRKKLVQRMARDRQYTLPRQMPLSEIMSIYQEIWHGDGGEC